MNNKIKRNNKIYTYYKSSKDRYDAMMIAADLRYNKQYNAIIIKHKYNYDIYIGSKNKYQRHGLSKLFQ